MVVESEQSPAKRKSAVLASTARKVSEKDELGPECWSDLSVDDGDSDPNVIPHLKKKRKKTLYLNLTDKDNAQSTSSTNLSHSPPAEIINNTTQPSMSSDSTQVIVTTKERSSERTKPKRKKRNPSAWARNERKRLRNSGQAYMTSRGKKAEARQMTDGCSTSCRYMCHANFGLEDRNQIFKNYWALQNIDLQRQFIHSTVTKTEVKRSYTDKKRSRRSNTFCYSLSVGGKGQPVCKKFYLATLGIKQDVVFGAIRKLTDTGAMVADMRGMHKNHPTLDENIVQDIRDHIKSFPTVPSHNVRQSSSKQYLKDGLSLAAMYRLYKEHCDKKGTPSAKEATYKAVFYRDFNIAFHKPKKNLCDGCQAFKNMPDPTDEQKEKQGAH